MRKYGWLPEQLGETPAEFVPKKGVLITVPGLERELLHNPDESESERASEVDATDEFRASMSGAALGALPHQRSQAAGPGLVYDRLTKLLVPQGWAILRLAWPKWVEANLSPQQLADYTALAVRDAARWVHNVLHRGPVSIVAWGSSSVGPAVEAAARLSWELDEPSAVELVATLSAIVGEHGGRLDTPHKGSRALGLRLGEELTLPYCLKACERELKVSHLSMFGAEDYCPKPLFGFGGITQQAAHVEAISSALAHAVARRPKKVGRLKALVQDRLLATAAVHAFTGGKPKVRPLRGIVDNVAITRWPESDALSDGRRRGWGWESDFRVRVCVDPRTLSAGVAQAAVGEVVGEVVTQREVARVPTTLVDTWDPLGSSTYRPHVDAGRLGKAANGRQWGKGVHVEWDHFHM